MLITQAKKGLRVRISKNIKKTKDRFGYGDEMERMAGNHKYYLITSVHSYDDAVNIDNFTFDVRDVIWDDEPGPEDVVLPGEKQHFNPEDLQL